MGRARARRAVAGLALLAAALAGCLAPGEPSAVATPEVEELPPSVTPAPEEPTLRPRCQDEVLDEGEVENATRGFRLQLLVVRTCEDGVLRLRAALFNTGRENLSFMAVHDDGCTAAVRLRATGPDNLSYEVERPEAECAAAPGEVPPGGVLRAEGVFTGSRSGTEGVAFAPAEGTYRVEALVTMSFREEPRPGVVSFSPATARAKAAFEWGAYP